MMGHNVFVPSKKPLQIPKTKLGNLQGPNRRYHLVLFAHYYANLIDWLW